MIDNEEVRLHCVNIIGLRIKSPLRRIEKRVLSLYETQDKSTTICCLVSKKYKASNITDYWFGLSFRMKNSLETSNNGFLVLGCETSDNILFIPYSKLSSHLGVLSTTEKKHGYWQLHVQLEDGRYLLWKKKDSPRVELTEYLL